MNQPSVTPASAASISGIAYQLATDYAGAHLYAGVGTLGVLGYSVNSSSGLLTALSGSPFVPPPVLASDVLVADTVAQFSSVYFDQRVFSILSTGALNAVTAPTSGAGIISAIAAVSPKDPPITTPVLSLSTASLQFPLQTAGTSSGPQSVTLSNTGVTPLLLGGISLTGNNASDFTMGTCQASLAPGEACTLTVSFVPLSAGSRTAAVSIVDNAPGSPHAIALSGIAVQPTGPVVSLSATSVQFAQQSIGTGSTPLAVKLSNTGNAALLLSGISLSGVNSSEFAVDYTGCAAVIAPTSGCTISVSFQPQFQGPRAAVLNFVDNAPGAPHTVALSGTAQLPFTFSADAPTGSIPAGQSVQFMLRLAPSPGFVGHVVLTCTGAPDQSTCDVPASFDTNGVSPIVFAATVSTKARSSFAPAWLWNLSHNQKVFGAPCLLGGTSLAILLVLLQFVLLRRESRLGYRYPREVAKAYACILLLVALALAGCSAGSGTATSVSNPPSTTTTTTPAPNPAPSSGTPAGQYSLTVTATFGSVTQSVPLTLSVN
jgi:hypothetical protein